MFPFFPAMNPHDSHSFFIFSWRVEAPLDPLKPSKVPVLCMPCRRAGQRDRGTLCRRGASDGAGEVSVGRADLWSAEVAAEAATCGPDPGSSQGDLTCGDLQQAVITGWWFGTCFIFPYIGKNNPNWLYNIFQRGRYTTNQMIIEQPDDNWTTNELAGCSIIMGIYGFNEPMIVLFFPLDEMEILHGISLRFSCPWWFDRFGKTGKTTFLDQHRGLSQPLVDACWLGIFH